VRKIDRDEIRSVGTKDFVEIHGDSISLLRLENQLDMLPIDPDLKKPLVIVPNQIGSTGILASKIVDSLVLEDNVSSPENQELGVMGRFIHNDRLVVMLDIYTLMHTNAPERYEMNIQPGLETKRILLVEDTLFFRHLVCNYFHSYGFRNITVTRNGREALDLLKDIGPEFDLIVSDVEMPVMDGFEFVSQLRSDADLKHLPTLALTGLEGAENIRRGMEAGFDAFENKIDKARVIKTVAKLLME
jgi:two-component system chemotaxis sensor kinase CheA